ncbi:hypothetical protein [Amycolatopsis sp. cmx-11-51]|uniref:hypothetical protein n=1 Tax=unclassified Amycolatopsis TaxID=2618356 RepID=UPI0039E4DA33
MITVAQVFDLASRMPERFRVDQHRTGNADDDDDGLSGQPCPSANGPLMAGQAQSKSPRSKVDIH